MRRPSSALLALVLLLQAASTSSGSNCERLANLSFNSIAEVEWRSVSQEGAATNVTLVWGSDPAHAAAALLSVLLRYVLRYRGVRLAPEPSPHATAALAASVPVDRIGHYTELVIGVSTSWEPVPGTWEPSQGPWPGLAGPRLAEFGASPVPARRRLLAWLAPAARTPACRDRVRRLFYDDRTAFADCDFVDAANRRGSTVNVLAVGDSKDMLPQLRKRARAANTTLNERRVDRDIFMRTMQTDNSSFLFLDYDMWEGAENVSVVDPPPCVTVDFDCKQELDSAIAIRVADVSILQTHAPELFQFVYDFNPTPESLRQILEQQIKLVDIEEAACDWAVRNRSYNVSEADQDKYDVFNYAIYIFLCWGDDSYRQYIEIVRKVGDTIYNSVKNRYRLIFRLYHINCSEKYAMSHRLIEWTHTIEFSNSIGMVSMTVEGAAAASTLADAAQIPLMLADVVPEEGTAANSTWRVAGRPRHVAHALHHFVSESGWSRIAVLSQETKLAADYYAALEDKANIVLRQFPIPLNLSEQQTQSVLQKLRDTNARIMFVNADSQAALTILTAAVTSGMSYSDGFVWILREWHVDEAVRQNKVVNGTKQFTISFWSRGWEDLPLAEGWQPLRDLWNKTPEWGHPWPPRAVSLANAMLSLSMGFKDVFQRYSKLRRDLHSADMIRLLEESLNETPVPGIGQRLHYAEHSIEETFVFVDQWCGGRFVRRLATWRVNATSGTVRGHSSERASYSRPHDLPHDDGSSHCIVHSGDLFDPTCYDIPCAFALLPLALAPGIVLLARRYLARKKQEQLIEAIARRQHVATVLGAYLVKRAALELREELGAGRFGSVCLARLREPGRAPRYVAAKALRDNAAPAEESEFLREACTIASLEHAHIVRLVGVCIADGPPLVLMELAFFGDLLGYLRERRHLVEGAGSEEPEANGEAEHVSAEALTRLAREAAEALQYLCMRGVVHRDVRAANCLVDERRSLKLADFGMARDTIAGADGVPEYACRRRGLFPVLWMAPESLAHGVFSAASDVWALGVLMLELVTLGERPYGSMSPLCVLQYVTAGGSPPLPLDATPQTRGLARLCWAHAAARRPSAAQVAAYLAARPRALCPALLSESLEPANADSGFCHPTFLCARSISSTISPPLTELDG